MSKKFNLNELRAKKPSTIDFDLGDEEFSVPAPGSWDDTVYEALKSEDTIKMAHLLFGEDEYARFRSAGGRADDLTHLFEAYAAEQGTDLPK